MTLDHAEQRPSIGKTFENIAVIGCGIIGSGITQVLAETDCRITKCERDESALDQGRSRVHAGLERGRAKGVFTQDSYERAVQSLRWTTALDDLVECDLVIEAVTDSEAIKIDLFTRLNALPFADEEVLATNTSSIPVIRIAMATSRPENAVGLHFFNPVPVVKLVEVIPSLITSDDVTARMRHFAEKSSRKTPVTAPDRAGFIVNALLVPYILDAIRMVDSGAATAAAIDMRCGSVVLIRWDRWH